MKRLILRTFVAFFAMLFAMITACDIEGPTPVAPNGDWQLLVVTDEAVSRLLVISQPDNKVVNANLFLNADSVRGIGGRVGKIFTFRENVYVLMPEQQRIEVLSATTYRRVATLNFAAQGRTPTDIIFTNATTGYIAFSNASVLSVLDITNFTIASEIQVGRAPVAFDVRGNQIYCAVRDENVVVVIDSRNAPASAVTTRIPVPTAPEFLRITPNGSEIVVLSVGGGSPRTAARASLINIAEKRVTREATLFFNAADSSTDRGYGLVLTERDFAYIPMNNALIRLDTRSLGRAIVLEGMYRSITYNPNRTELLVASADSNTVPTCTILNPANDSTKAIIRLDSVRMGRVRQVFSR
jgi:DNA-binding beta-propeller fold protein YncE